MRTRIPSIHLALGAYALAAAVLVGVPSAQADEVAYLLNVTVRPGYPFASPDAALAYGHALCDKIAAGGAYAQVMADVKSDVDSPDEYQASYLVSQAVNELCPAVIWQLRNSAANYHPPGVMTAPEGQP